MGDGSAVTRDLSRVLCLTKAYLAEHAGSFSVYLGDLNSGASFVLNDHRVPSASIVKLYVMGAVLEAVESGTLPDSPEIMENLRDMITVSSNDAWVFLSKLLGGGDYISGMEQVNRWADANGYPDSGRRAEGEYTNTTSASDTGHFLEKVLRGTNVSPAASEQMLALLKAQTRTWKLPAGVPEGIVTANKTGELDAFQNDAAIIFAPRGTYILVVLSEGGTVEDLRALSKLVYEAMEN